MTTKQEKDRQKQIQDKCQTLLTQMLRDEDNKYCVDCDSKGPRWASWNLGVFLCIRCAGIHRNLGVHISKVKSVNLDSWTPEQVVSLQQMGNSRARAVYEANLPDNFRRPQTDSSLEAFVRAKYEHKKFIAREWVPPPIPKVNWDKELDEEAERQRRRKKEAKREASATVILSAKITPDPLPLPKPSSSPKTPRGSQNTAIPAPSASQDLLGLDTPLNSNTSVNSSSNSDDFTNFLSAPPAPSSSTSETNDTTKSGSESSRSAEEESFFNQPAPTTQEKRQMTKDSILALYATAPPTGNFGVYSQAPTGVGQHMVPGVPGGFPLNMPQHPNPMMQNGMFGAMPGQQNLASNPFFNMPQNTMPAGMPVYTQMNQSGPEDLMFELTPANLAKLPQQMARMSLGGAPPASGTIQTTSSFPGQQQPPFFQQTGNTLTSNLWQ